MGSAHQGVYACEVWKSYPTMGLNANLTLTLEMSKVKVKDKGRIG